MSDGANNDGDYKPPSGRNDDAVEDTGDVKGSAPDAQQVRDDQDAIDESNIIEERTRGAAKSDGEYREPGDSEGLEDPADN